jgi:hypothetical protein
LQALKYGAYCAKLTLEELAEELAAYQDTEFDEAHPQLIDHAPVLDEGEPRPINIRLVAGSGASRTAFKPFA